jgi:hypothetical protein
MAPKVFASTGLLVDIKENRVNYRYRVDYQIWHEKRSTFSISLPDTNPIENVTGAGLSEWKVNQTDSGAVLVARTSFSPDRAYRLTVEFSSKLETVESTVAIPVLRVLDVNRESGFVAVQASQTMEVFADASMSNLTAVAARELPDWLQAEREVLMRLKYNRPPYTLTLAIRRHKDMPVLVAIADEALFTGLMTRNGYSLAKYRYFIRNNHKQYLRLHMSEEWRLWSALIDGEAVMPASAESASDVLIPLKKMSQTDEGSGFTLELVYWREARKMGFAGKIVFETPVIDMNCQQMNGELWMPDRYRYARFGGALENVRDYTSTYLASSQPQVKTRRRSLMPVQSNTFALGTKGKTMSLPVEIEIPRGGVRLLFSKKLTIAGEEGNLTFRFRKRVPGMRRVGGFVLWALTLLLTFLACRHMFLNYKEHRIWPLAAGLVLAVVVLAVVNLILGIGAPGLLRTAVIGALCATLAHLGRTRAKEVVA